MTGTRVERFKEYRDSITSTNCVKTNATPKTAKKSDYSQTDTLPMDDVISQINTAEEKPAKKKIDKTTLAVVLSIAGIVLIIAVLVIIGIKVFSK